jgi:phosphatidylinositol-bisphosphatase
MLRNLPKIELSSLTLEFDQVKYECERSIALEIKNVGNTLAHWHFVAKTEESKVSKRWLSFKPCRGLLKPNEVATITFTIFVDKKTAQAINLGRDNLVDNLTLRVENAYDTFIGVMAEYERSCFGMLLEELLYTPGPVRETSPIEYRPGKNNEIDESTILNNILTDTKLSIPKELWRLVDALWSTGAIRETDLFVTEGNPDEVKAIRESLDTGTDFPVCSAHSIVETFISFLSALPQPILPPSTYPTSEIDPQNLRSWSRRFLESLPPMNYNLFIYILSFFRELLAESDYNRLIVTHLASICINVMTPLATDPEISKEEREKRVAKQEFLVNIIMYYLVVPVL